MALQIIRDYHNSTIVVPGIEITILLKILNDSKSLISSIIYDDDLNQNTFTKFGITSSENSFREKIMEYYCNVVARMFKLFYNEFKNQIHNSVTTHEFFFPSYSYLINRKLFTNTFASLHNLFIKWSLKINIWPKKRLWVFTKIIKTLLLLL